MGRLILILFIVSLVFIVACAQPSTTAGTTTTKTVTATVTATPSSTPQKVFNIKFQSQLNPGDVLFQAEDKLMAKELERASNGRLKVSHTGSGTIVPDAEMFTAVSAGTVDMCYAYSLYWAKTMPVAEIAVGFPRQYRNNWEQIEVLKRGLEDIYREVYAKYNVYFITEVTESSKDLQTSKKPINRLSDLKGLKLRAGGAYGTMLSELGGASTVVVPVGELYTSITTGLLDGYVFGNIGVADLFGLLDPINYVVAPHISGGGGGSPYLMNMDVWKSLPPDLQSIVQNVVASAAREENLYMKPIWEVATKFRARGGKFTSLPDEDWKKMEEWTFKQLDIVGAKDPDAAKAAKIVKNFMLNRL